ncbi:PREDICTED: farnesol dehydrogenase-like [Bactrocera latifrons]|uniref:farnesol dehydrogenase-like n=1 Tax=Bactrocera latifrons TaxID=174628 RepID=UPI0008DC615C|nr:PREDICTED: farnesol dehydrogenase-like [Bactrocera latifrons]
MERWENRVAVVTGASSGMGAAIAKYLANNKLVTVNLDINKEGHMTVIAEVNAVVRKRMHFIKCNVRKEDEINAAFREIEKNYGPIAVLVNNAGVVGDSFLLSENNSKEMLKVLETNLLAAVYCTREAFRSMKANDIGGHVFMIGSVCGHKVPIVPNNPLNLYPPTKFAIKALTEMYRQEFFGQNTKIKVTCISPGAVKTNLLNHPGNITPKLPAELNPNAIADLLIYCLQTPPDVHIHDVIIKPLGEMV